jgi:hypothetical protein
MLEWFFDALGWLFRVLMSVIIKALRGEPFVGRGYVSDIGGC